MCTSPASDRLGRAGGLAEASAATTGVSLAHVSRRKTVPITSIRPVVACRSCAWACACDACDQFAASNGDRIRADPDLAPPPCVPQRGVFSTPLHAQRHPRPHTPHAASGCPLTMPVPMLLSGRRRHRVCAAASVVAVEHPSVMDLSGCTMPRCASAPVEGDRS